MISHPEQESASGHEDQIGGFGRVVGNVDLSRLAGCEHG